VIAYSPGRRSGSSKWRRRWKRLSPLPRCNYSDTGDVGPSGEGLGAAGPEVCGGAVVATAGENIGDLVMGGKEALNLPRRLEPLHDPLSTPGRLMGVFDPVIEALVCRC
jgi:hypothetical protein